MSQQTNSTGYVPSGADVFSALLSKAKSILLNPKQAWPEIAAHQETTTEVYKGYLIYMAAIGPVCGLIGGTISGMNMGITSGIITAIITYALALVMPMIMSFVIGKIAPMCSGEISFDNGVRLIVYSATATYISGFLSLIPLLSILSILFMIYAIYTMYLGVSHMSTVPQDQAVKFTVITVVAWFLLSIIVGLLVMPLFVGGAALSGMDSL